MTQLSGNCQFGDFGPRGQCPQEEVADGSNPCRKVRGALFPQQEAGGQPPAGRGAACRLSLSASAIFTRKGSRPLGGAGAWPSFLPTARGAARGGLPPPRASPASPPGSRLCGALHVLPGLKRGAWLLACSGVCSVGGVRCPVECFCWAVHPRASSDAGSSGCHVPRVTASEGEAPGRAGPGSGLHP